MTKMNKLYRILSIGSFVLHICIFVFVIIVGFLPYREQDNFYQCFEGYFGKTLNGIQPYIVMAILLLSCVASYFTIKYPLYSFLVFICMMIFFVLATLPYSLEATIVSFASIWGDANMATYGIGLDLIGKVSYIIYFDKVFCIISAIIFFINPKSFR